MSTIKSSAENLTLNADGANNDIIFQSNGSNVATLDQAGLLTATTFAGSGASLTALNATNLGSGTVPTARLGTGTADSSVHLRGDGTWAAAGGGKVLQVITDTATATVNTTSGTWSDIGITVAITPSATSSKILVMTHCLASITGSSATYIGMRLLRDSTALMEYGRLYERHGYDISTIIPFIYLDSPSSTSALTYKVQGSNPGGSGTTKFVQEISNRGVATITGMEIEG